MRNRLMGTTGRGLARGAAFLAAATFLAGCSSGVTRFQDSIFTGSTANQRSIIKAPDHQPYPGDQASAPANGAYTASASRGAVEPVQVASTGAVQRAELPPAQPAHQPAPAVAAALRPEKLDATVTGATPPRPEKLATAAATTAAAERQEGWSAAGGTQIEVRQGETVYNLSRRFGVPADAILKANGLSSPNELAAGQKVVIPTYVYSRKAPVSAPDSHPEVASAKSSRGTRVDVPSDKAPTPSPAPLNKVAVLPEAPKPRERSAPGETADATPAKAPASTGGNVYTVVSGDSLYGIARKLGVKATDLKTANGLSDGVLRIGQKLVIPAAGATVAAAETPRNVDTAATGSTPKKSDPKPEQSPVTAYTPPKAQTAAEKKSDAVIEEATQTAAIAPEATGVGRMRWPVRGRVIAGYGRSGGRSSDGIDIAVPEGTPVKAAENGVVIYAGDGLKEFGNTVLVRHEDGLVTVYGHASELKVARGDKVSRGQEIARSGMSGSADMPKLHFEVRKDSAPVDPATYLE